MPFNFYDTHTLLTSVQQLPPLHTFLLDRYFPTNEATDIFATDDVLVEYRKGHKKASPFVAPRKGGIIHYETLHAVLHCAETPSYY